MAEDWRVTIALENADSAGRLRAALHAHEAEAESAEQLGNRVAVSGSDDHIFLYADSETAARHAEQIARELLASHELKGSLKLDRWHPDEEAWEDASVPLPSTDAEREAEHERLEQQEEAESRATGLAEWEVRIELGSRDDANAFADQLEREGFDSVVRRWTYVLVGTASEDDARALAERLQGEAPAGATIEVEPAGGQVWQLLPTNPFAVFGGLAG